MAVLLNPAVPAPPPMSTGCHPKVRRYFGLDVHEHTIYVSEIVLPEGGKGRVEQYEFPWERKALEAFLGQLRPGDRVGIEATRNSRYLYERVRSQGAEAVVANPRKLHMITAGNAKTDRNDSFALAFLTAARMLPTVWIPDDQTQQDRELLQARFDLCQESTRYKNRIRALLAQHGLTWPGSDIQHKDMQFLLLRFKTSLPLSSQEVLRTHLETLEALARQLARMDALITSRAGQRPGVRLLMTIRGVDVVTALTMLAYIGPIERFATPGSLVNYAGLVPRAYESGKTKKGKKKRGKRGRIRKGPKPLRWALTMVVQQLRKLEGKYHNLYRRVSRKSGEGAAVVACARKLLEAIWHMLTRNEPFRLAEPELIERKQRRRQARLEAARKTLSREEDPTEAFQTHLALLQELARCTSPDLPMPTQLLPSFGRLAPHAQKRPA